MIKSIQKIGLVMTCSFLFLSTHAQTTFSNSSPITIIDNAPANLYPSPISVTGMTGTISNITVTINGLNHAYVHDVSIILQAPSGESLLLQSGVADTWGVTNLNYTISDAGATQMSGTNPLVAGTYKPTDYFWDIWNSPAPATPPGIGTYNVPGPFTSIATKTLATTFNGLAPNGQWKLFVADFAVGDGGSISNGWSLAITTQVVLPVQLINFSGVCNNNDINLRWSYNNQSNFKNFELLKSVNNKEFESIGTVNPKGENIIHQFTYKNIYGTNPIYFKLKMIDNDNTATFSDVIDFNCSQKNPLSVFPTITSNFVNIKSETGDLEKIELLDAIGKSVFKIGNINSYLNVLNLQEIGLTSGIYYLKVTRNSTIESIKIIKQ